MAEAKAVPCGEIELRLCSGCGLVFNSLFDPALAEIGEMYESSQGASAYFGAYSRSLATDWVERFGLAGKTVLEIGSAHGDFLVDLVRAGAGRVIGLDPIMAKVPAVAAADDRIELRSSAFDDSQVEIEADAVVCRHTLEHIQSVGGFLRSLHAWTTRDPARVVLFDVPASERIFAEGAFWEVLYEHTNYFTRASLSFAFTQAGFEVQRVSHVYGDQYLLLEGRAAGGGSVPSEPCEIAAGRSAATAFAERACIAIEHARRNLNALAKEGPLVIWQGAAKTVGFLTMLAQPGLVDCAVDLSPSRHGYYLPGSGLKVVAPAHIPRMRPRHIILMNPIYEREVQTMLDAMSSDARLLTINQICEELVHAPR
jgi:hypothetical protein